MRSDARATRKSAPASAGTAEGGTRPPRLNRLPLARLGGQGGRRVRAYVALLHPFPSFLNAIVVGVLACIAVRGWPGTAPVLWLPATMLCIQFAIGALNDWADRRLDAAVKPWKPVPSGHVAPATALMIAAGLASAGALLAIPGGPAAWLLAMAGLMAGVAYDLGLKRTPFSALTYAVALPLVPLWVWSALGRAGPALVAVLPVGLLLGVSLQLLNALPDAAGDAAGGVRGTLQWLGVKRGRRAAWLCFGLALLVALALAPLFHLRGTLFWPCWFAAAILLVIAVAIYRRRPTPRSLQVGWTMLAPAAGLLAAGWLASLP
jgi:4-hydroxybenzoate polyprenyltransferase